MLPRLREKYDTELVSALAESLGRKNRLSLPRLVKIVVNMGVGSAISEKKHMDEAMKALTLITGYDYLRAGLKHMIRADTAAE